VDPQSFGGEDGIHYVERITGSWPPLLSPSMSTAQKRCAGRVERDHPRRRNRRLRPLVTSSAGSEPIRDGHDRPLRCWITTVGQDRLIFNARRAATTFQSGMASSTGLLPGQSSQASFHPYHARRQTRAPRPAARTVTIHGQWAPTRLRISMRSLGHRHVRRKRCQPPPPRRLIDGDVVLFGPARGKLRRWIANGFRRVLADDTRLDQQSGDSPPARLGFSAGTRHLRRRLHRHRHRRAMAQASSLHSTPSATTGGHRLRSVQKHHLRERVGHADEQPRTLTFALTEPWRPRRGP